MIGFKRDGPRSRWKNLHPGTESMKLADLAGPEVSCSLAGSWFESEWANVKKERRSARFLDQGFRRYTK
jgi:hypothetical protein